MTTADPLQQLIALRIEIAPETQAEHVAAISRTLAATTKSAPVLRWAAVAAVVTALSIPVAAVASESAIPGDFLYPVKQALEPVRALVDDTVVAQHRVDELGVMIDRGFDPATIDRQIDAAVDALDDVDAPALEAEFGRLLDRLAATDEPADDPTTSDDAPATDTTTDVADVETTLPPITDAPTRRDLEPPPATTVPPSDVSGDAPADRPTTTAPPGDAVPPNDGDPPADIDPPTDSEPPRDSGGRNG